jgi:uncharacterized protein (TIGR02145 family)
MIPAGQEQSNNQLIEKYCYDNDSVNCEMFGGMYQWKEAMNYLFPLTGAKGICPSGYHIPTDDEWRELEAYTDSQYSLLDTIWNLFGFRGFDAGKRMKALMSWNAVAPGNNLSGFTALASGSWEENDGFQGLGMEATYWSASHISSTEIFTRSLEDDEDRISMNFRDAGSARSIRCIKD